MISTYSRLAIVGYGVQLALLTKGENIMQVKKQRLTKEQKAAVQHYEFCLRQEDRYLGSVFANAHGQRLIEEKTRQAYENAKRLGVNHLC
jgi:hypothetical protein